MSYRDKYLATAKSGNNILNRRLSGSVTWSSPSNIALIKYWGKKGFQLPSNPSLSFSLDNARTITKIEYESVPEGAVNRTEFLFEGIPNEAFAAKTYAFLENVVGYLPFLSAINLKIDTRNTFPHSAGIASSASSMSALALCLMSIESRLSGNEISNGDFFEKASFLARIGSGSACRSVFSNYALWGEYPEIPDSSDELAIPLTGVSGEYFDNICDVILIVNSSPKKTGSSRGHELMNSNRFARERFAQADSNLGELLNAAANNDIDRFIEVVEEEALTLHTMMMTSRPSFLLMEPNTLAIIEKIRNKRESDGIKIMFTLDAGPNVHLIYTKKDEQSVMDFVSKELNQFCQSGKVIYDRIGKGPVILGEENG